MGEEESSSSHRGNKKDRNRKPSKRHPSPSQKSSSKQGVIRSIKNKKQKKGHMSSSKDENAAGSLKLAPKNAGIKMSSNQHDLSRQQALTLRKKVDPETTKYFMEIANLFQKNEIDMEEHPTICGNALEETRGKEVELATDMIISQTIQNLLEGCDLDQLCRFLRSCANEFPTIATDRFGSHVAETSLKSLARHLEEEGSYAYIKVSLSKLCQVVVADAINIMCSRYGSHVLRSLLCLCKGVPFDSLEEFHATKRHVALAERLSNRPLLARKDSRNLLFGFPEEFKFLIRELLNHERDEIKSLRFNQCSSYVLQAALKLLVGDDGELLHTILVLLGCHEKNIEEDKSISDQEKQEIMALLEDTASSHLLEVIIEVAPEPLYDKLLTEVFEGSLLEMSFHPCGNFVVQALASSARTKEQLDVIWKELGKEFKEILEHGKPGVVASILAACQRLQVHEYECCRTLAAAVSSDLEAPSCIIPHMLFLDSYFRNKTDWKWPLDDKMNVLGCLMLQTIFRYPKKYIKPYIRSITSMDADHIFQIVKDAGGARVFEVVLCSDVSTDRKLEMIAKLQGYYGELALNPSSSFTIEKCFTVSNISLKEAIAAELLDVQAEINKKKHGPYLLKKLDVDGFADRPEQWRQTQLSKQSAYKEFQMVFGSDSSSHKENLPTSESLKKSSKGIHKKSEQENADVTSANMHSEFPGLEISMAKLGFPVGRKGKEKFPGLNSEKFISNNVKTSYMKTSYVKTSGKRKSSMDELAELAGKSELSSGDVRKLFSPTIKTDTEQSVSARVPFIKKQKR